MGLEHTTLRLESHALPTELARLYLMSSIGIIVREFCETCSFKHLASVQEADIVCIIVSNEWPVSRTLICCPDIGCYVAHIEVLYFRHIPHTPAKYI